MTWRRLAVAAILACSLSLLVAPGAPVSGTHPLIACLALAFVIAAVTRRCAPTAVAASSVLLISPSALAQRRRRGAYLRQSNPDIAGHTRPRAPGLSPG